jgi:hypothetical protein
MRKLAFILPLILLLLLACAAGKQASGNGQEKTSISDQIKSGMRQEKDIAESILFNARVLLNTGIITPVQYVQVRTAYEKLRKTQNALVDSYVLIMQSPTAANSSAYQLNAMQLIKDIKALTDLAVSLGVIKEGT